MSTVDERLFAAIFGCSKEQQAVFDAEKAENDKRRDAKDWADAQRVAELASEDFPQHRWVAARMYESQPCAIAVLEDGTVLCAKAYGDSVGHTTLSEYDVRNTEVEGSVV